jgi:single-stranded-DNA-specific exonuclease
VATIPRIHRRPVPGAAADLRAAGLSPLLARLYAARGIRAAAELDAGLDGLPDPAGLAGMDDAVAVLLRARRDGARICIVGDYDADGATSTAVLLEGLAALGFGPLSSVVPDRVVHGYGLTPSIVAEARSRADVPGPDLIVTVDNGIASVDGVAAAAEAGIEVVVTDHHLPGPVRPEAAALLDPRLGGSGAPGECLAGVGVAFLLLVALRRALREAGALDGDGPKLAELLDLVALGTVADLVPLDRGNRILVDQGLRRIRAGRTRPGIRALAEVAGRDRSRLTAADVGFALAPRLNAAGRLDDMGTGVRLLTSRDDAEARELAGMLDELNRERRRIQQSMEADAERLADAVSLDGELPWGLCLSAPHWHPGVVGIVAARVRERTHRPVIAFAPTGDGWLRGSARSVPKLHVRDALEAVATAHPGLVERFGGHAMAAGLTLAEGDYDRFVDAFDAEVRRHLAAGDLRGEFVTDGALDADELDLRTARVLEASGPWGQAFPEPSFDGEFAVADARVVGGDHVRLTVETGGRRLAAIAFGGVAHGWDAPPARVRLVYRLTVNRFRDAETAQLVVEHLEPA